MKPALINNYLLLLFVAFALLPPLLTLAQKRATNGQPLQNTAGPLLAVANIQPQGNIIYTLQPQPGHAGRAYYEVDNTLIVSFSKPFSISVKVSGDMEGATPNAVIPIGKVKFSIAPPEGGVSDQVTLSTTNQVVVRAYKAGLNMKFKTICFLPATALNITAPGSYSTTLTFEVNELQ